MRRLHYAAALAMCLAQPAFAQPAAAPQAAMVGTVIAAKQDVTKGLDFVGRVEAIQRVDIHARVTGFLEAVLFTEGSTVKEGDKLYQIERPPFEAAVLQARGNLVQAQAQYANATLERQRAEELVKTSAVSVAIRDQRVAAEQSAQGQVIVAEAALQTATINLGYTAITAPITGKIGRTLVTKGNVVGPDSGTLAQIVSEDPMYVTFPVSNREFLRMRQAGGQVDVNAIEAVIRFADGSTYDQRGRITFVNVSVDKATDTLLVRASVPNPTGVLVDGEFVRVLVQGDKPEQMVVVPQAALIADQEGIYVFIVEGGKAVVRRIRTGGETGRDVIVNDGLKGGEQVVVQGLQSLRPGAAVIATPLAPAAGG
ncbi:efflux RND transporter periplasmic adaptor subunit [Limobrevibacterium gyesilva]|uniref:Efflux RND transporter periplasmic adaptor subunit n=1 Tax=Limobrevibacterium gyesilva TaxID=2991712 RepID=A0AA41YP28_9PROT|nr:efflux RND transporter periplasmic adaptor subunit [Limobrevibacterium gyesilva]MCW3475648.1 efflux RND transporter periplasmic adaptor subunit [Limobrevibacterium gyesilva]